MNVRRLAQYGGALAAGALAVLLVTGRTGPWRRVDPAALAREIQALDELVTVRYRIQKVVGLEEKKSPFGSEKLLLIVQADVLAGVDLKAITAASVARAGNRVAVRLPEPAILRVVIDEKQTKVWDRQITWWTPWAPYNNDLERQAREAAIADIRKTALEMGILDDARRNARQSIGQLLQAFGIELVDAT